MPYILIAAAVFAFFVWLGREAKSGRLKKGPWIKDFRVVRSVLGMILMGGAATFLIRGQYLFAAILAALSVGVSQTARFTRRQSKDGLSYTEAEIKAYQTLGLAVGSSKNEIKAAHKSLMKAAHPDAGGSQERAKALNAARDLLLKRRV